MNAVFLIAFRESLEAALIIGILFAAMRALGIKDRYLIVWGGVFWGVFFSVVFAWGFSTFFGGFEGIFEELYEGGVMLFSGLLITHLIFWMKKQGKVVAQKLNKKVKESLDKGGIWSLGVLASLVVLREGVEMVIFFQALFVQSEQNISVTGAVLGILMAVWIACIVYFSTLKVPVTKLFTTLSYFLILVAAGLIAHSVIEFQKVGVLPILINPLYDLSDILPEKEGIGAFLKSTFGYNQAPSLIATGVYWLYLLIVGWIYLRKS